jgi:hypothetical protein
MFGLRRIRQLQAENAVLRGALDFYAINDNWRRRAKHVKGRHWELSAAGKDHGARAREALVKADAIRRRPLAKFVDKVRQLVGKRASSEPEFLEIPASLRRSQAPVLAVTVPAPRPLIPTNQPAEGASHVLP